MSARFINGAKYAVSTQLATAVAIAAITNANPAVASSTTLPAEGDVVLLTSGWAELNDTIARALDPAAGTFKLEGVNTTDTARFPPGEGGGTYEVAGTFVGLSQVRNVEMSGGEQQYFQWQYVEDQGGRQRQAPTYKNAMAMNITLDYDPDLPWYEQLIELDRKRQPVVLRETLPGSNDVIYYIGTLAFNKVPTKTINENMTVQASFSLSADPIRYPGA